MTKIKSHKHIYKYKKKLDNIFFLWYIIDTSARFFCCALFLCRSSLRRFRRYSASEGDIIIEGALSRYVTDKHTSGFGAPRGKERTRYMRVKVTLACSECKQRNYDTAKNKKNDPDRIEISKYCRFCRKHTVHKETK